MPERTRPTFDKAPVAEVVCGITFQPLARMQAPHFGLFWNLIRSDFPQCQTAAPIMPSFETGVPEMVTVNVLQPFGAPRILFTNDKGDGIIQLQNGRFIYNWKRNSPSDPYPRYPEVVQRFRRFFELFVKFAEDEGLGDIPVLELEMTYVNHVPTGEGWASFSDVGDIFPDLCWRRDARYLTGIAGLAWRARFDLPGGEGSLFASVHTGHVPDDPERKPVLRFDLTARGRPTEPGERQMWHWFDRANEWIVDGFIDLTSKQVQQGVWKRSK